MLHFLTLCSLVNYSLWIHVLKTAFIHILTVNIAVGFHTRTEVMLFAKDPFNDDTGGVPAADTNQVVLMLLYEGPLQLGLTDMREASDLKQMYKFVGCEHFHLQRNQVQFPNTRRLAIFLIDICYFSYMPVKCLTQKCN